MLRFVQEPMVVDEFSPISHKAPLQPRQLARGVAGPSWLSPEDRKRLAAYRVRDSYLKNVARQALPEGTADEVRDQLREYGDPQVMLDRTRAGVLGSDWTVGVDGADADPSEGPAIPPRPEPTPPVDDDEAQAVLTALDEERLVQWRADVVEAADAFRESRDTQALLRSREAAVRAWADKVHLPARIHEGEQNAIGLGDGVYVLWHQDGDWPLPQSLEPDGYFPALDDAAGEYVEFPDRVDFGWEYEVTDAKGQTTRFLRRITFELVELQEIRAGFDDLGRSAWIDENGQPSLSPSARPDERVGADGIVRRRYPWQPTNLPLDQWSTRVCVHSDGTWDLSKTSISGLTDLSDAAASWKYYRQDYGVDFLPVVHVPNTPAGPTHFGSPVIDQASQVLDDVARNDTEIMSASRYIGHPTLAMSGQSLPEEGFVAPGQVYSLGDNGTMTTLDLSGGIEKLMAQGDRLQDRLWQSAGVPAEVLGRAESGPVAGITLALRFSPFAQLVGVLRMTREPKYRLLLKMAQRMAQVQGALEPGETPEARLRWGNFMPTDREATIKSVAEALRAHAMSTQTAVAMLVAAGLPVDDARAEVDRIHSEDTESANQLADALADAAVVERVRVVADRLGVDIAPPDSGPLPNITLPATGGDAA